MAYLLARLKSAMLLALCLPTFAALTYGQSPCTCSISGRVLDNSGQSLPGAVVRLLPDSAGTSTDADGAYLFSNVCKGRHTLVFDGIGYKRQAFTIDLKGSNAKQDFRLIPAQEQLQEVVVNGERHNEISTTAKASLTGTQLFKTRGSTLGESLKELTGLNSIQTGPSLSKPVIHGLHSNRVLLLNNGVRQEGQQWGSEHAPEIDPFVADNITVIKGAASIRYGSDAVAGVVLLDPPVLPSDGGLSGNLYSILASNGRMGVLSGMLQDAFAKKLSGLAIRIQGTAKRAGNFQTPNYYLRNTGLAEYDFSGTAAYKWKALDTRVFYSQYFTQIGIFEGSHVGNINDLYAAFTREKPLTASLFSYDIARSYQQVRHSILKLSSTYHLTNGGRIEASFSSQKDLREEYDIDLPYSTNPDVLDKPQISFQLKTQTAELHYAFPVRGDFSGSVGVEGETQGNVFKGIRYLVPNFRRYNGGAYAIEKYNKGKLELEVGLRYDYQWLQVYQLNQVSLQQFHTTFDYSNVTGTAGASYRFSNAFHTDLNFGTAWRVPSINELYIHGIHLSAASYETGDSTLESEHAYNTSLSLHYHSKALCVVLDLYDNEIGKFIYAKPSLVPVTIISGTYPAFQYTQADVRLTGSDVDVLYDPAKHFTLRSKTSLVRGHNKTENGYLIFMPADRFQTSLTFHLDSLGRLRTPYITLENLTVSRQNRVPPNSDYVAPPEGYSLLNASMGGTFSVEGKALDVDVSAQNLTNVAYRDYLNRFRYYADELGINFILRLKLSF